MSDEQEKPKPIDKFYEEYDPDSLETIINITLRLIEDGDKNKVAVGIGARKEITDILKKDDSFRFAVKDSFLRWLDEVAGVN